MLKIANTINSGLLATIIIAGVTWAFRVEHHMGSTTTIKEQIEGLEEDICQRIERLEEELRPILVEYQVHMRMSELSIVSDTGFLTESIVRDGVEEEVDNFLMEQKALPK